MSYGMVETPHGLDFSFLFYHLPGLYKVTPVAYVSSGKAGYSHSDGLLNST